MLLSSKNHKCPNAFNHFQGARASKAKTRITSEGGLAKRFVPLSGKQWKCWEWQRTLNREVKLQTAWKVRKNRLSPGELTWQNVIPDHIVSFSCSLWIREYMLYKARKIPGSPGFSTPPLFFPHQRENTHSSYRTSHGV